MIESNKFMTVEVDDPAYTPSRFINTVLEMMRLQNDLQLATRLKFNYSQLNRIRNRRIPMCPNFVIAVMDETGLNLKQIRHLAGVEK